MGVDACIQFSSLRDADLNTVAFELAKWTTGDQFYKHPCIEFDDEDDCYKVLTWSRHYGPGYERGDWPTLRGILLWLMSRVDGVEYAADTDHDYRPAALVIAENDNHWLQEGYPYRWDEWHIGGGLPVGCERPIDAYGQPMHRHGWGGDYAAFHSLASSETRVWRDGAWVEPVK